MRQSSLSTAATMKSLILAAVILQLVIIGIKTDGKYQFGDIIEFPRKIGTYSHYAVYVGPESGVNVSQGDNGIFHRTALKEKRYTCEFGKLNKTRGKSNDKKRNYLDNDKEYPAENRTPVKIRERIEEKNEECRKYKVFTNNCEHLATYVRYGIGRSLQKGRIAQIFLRPIDFAKRMTAKTENICRISDDNNNNVCTP
ncbi:phospholipase A and acyltransferase 3-like isoform X2 [Sparus aurata]|uniref:phospholipase A and acyltransferase 3-like isoform X2 n=1 Tax=Sparus aurata TaxID=8175 RepID=UPI0011C1143B|nr:phospholipase A and acyltransferase 3-like isoform X2 [Sparus aurata]